MPELSPVPPPSALPAAHELVAPPPTGVVFVPCAICSAALDLAVLAATDRTPLCDEHRVGDYHPFS
jgi:hypothetical protein